MIDGEIAIQEKNLRHEVNGLCKAMSKTIEHYGGSDVYRGKMSKEYIELQNFKRVFDGTSDYGKIIKPFCDLFVANTEDIIVNFDQWIKRNIILNICPDRPEFGAYNIHLSAIYSMAEQLHTIPTINNDYFYTKYDKLIKMHLFGIFMRCAVVVDHVGAINVVVTSLRKELGIDNIDINMVNGTGGPTLKIISDLIKPITGADVDLRNMDEIMTKVSDNPAIKTLTEQVTATTKNIFNKFQEGNLSVDEAITEVNKLVTPDAMNMFSSLKDEFANRFGPKATANVASMFGSLMENIKNVDLNSFAEKLPTEPLDE